MIEVARVDTTNITTSKEAKDAIKELKASLKEAIKELKHDCSVKVKELKATQKDLAKKERATVKAEKRAQRDRKNAIDNEVKTLVKKVNVDPEKLGLEV